ncbi:hypothetical protein [Vreelandella sp. GE22]
MRKWILLALFNWLRKPANRQKAKNAWNKYRGNAASRPGQQPGTRPGGAQRRPNDIKDINERF